MAFFVGLFSTGMFLLEDMLTVQTKKYFNFKRNKKKGCFSFWVFLGFLGKD